MTEFDTNVKELVHLRPRMRGDISITINQEGKERVFIVEDPVRNKFFRIGEPEYRLLGLLDGKTTVGEALIQIAQGLGQDALTESEAAVVLNWAMESNLLESESKMDPEQIIEARLKKEDQKFLRKMNPMFLRFPLCNPDQFLSFIRPLTRYFFSPLLVLIWGVVVVGGLFQILSNLGRFSTQASGVLATSNWISLLVVWVVLKFIHELFHGIACKHYGGRVTEAGVIMILLAPIGYVDATSSWKFDSRWRRMFTAAAGIYIEFFIAGIAAFIWADSEPGQLRDICYNIILIASINTLIFNANPLMKFDGYYIFSDLVNIPNLYLEGGAYVKYLGRRYLLGVPTQFPQRGRKDDTVIKIYGVLSFIWRMLVITTLIIIASTLFHGFGILFAMLAVGVIVIYPALKFLRYLFFGNDHEKPKVLRFVSVMSLLAGVLYFSLFQFEWRQSISVHGLVEFEEVKEYRTLYPAKIAEILVQDGDIVEVGDPLIRLENDELVLAVEQQRNNLTRIQIERKKLLSEKKLGEYQALLEQETAAKSQILDSEKLLQGLLIVATNQGEVIMPPAGNLYDRHVTNSDILLSVASSDDRELRLAIPQREINRITVDVEDKIEFYLPGRKSLTATVKAISPVADDTVSNPFLTALGGGALPVISAENGDYKMTEPYFWMTGRLEGTSDQNLGAGERGMSSLQGSATSLGFLWIRSVRDWATSITAQIAS